MVDRQSIGTQGTIQKTSKSQQTVSSGYQVSAHTKSTLAGEFASAAGGVASAAAGYLNQRVEADKVKQQQLSIMGLAPSEDATRGGKRAHMLVSTQNSVMESAMRLKGEAARFEGSDDEWADLVASERSRVQDDIMAQYPELKGDTNTEAALTNIFMEQSPAIAGARITTKIEREHETRINDFRDHLMLETQSLDAEQLSAKMPELEEHAKSLGLMTDEYRKIVEQQAIQEAATGDTDLVAATQQVKDENGVSLYEQSGKLQKAAVRGKKVWAQNHQNEVADMRNALMEEFSAGLSWEDFTAKAQEQNRATGNTAWTDTQMLALKANRAKNVASAARSNDVQLAIRSGDLVGIGDFSKKELKDAGSDMLSMVDQNVDQMVIDGRLQPNQAEGQKALYKSRVRTLLASAGIIDEQFTNQIKNMQNLTSDHFQEPTVEPKEIKAIMDTWASMPLEERTAIVPDEQAAFIENYLAGQDMHMNPAQAIDFAQKASRNVWVDAKGVQSDADGVASDVADGTYGNPFDNMPSSAKAQIKAEAVKLITSLRKANYSDEKANEVATEKLSRNFTMVGDTLVKGNRDQLAQAMRVHPEDLELQLQGYYAMHKQELMDAGGVDSTEDMYFDIDTDRGIARVRSGEGQMLVSAPISLTELGDVKYPKYLEQMSEQERIEQSLDLNRRMNNVFNPQAAKPYEYHSAYTGQIPQAEQPSIPKIEKTVLPTKPVGEIQARDKLINSLQQSENSIQAGFDAKNKVWTPYDSDLGTAGTDTIAYGHYITPAERKNGFIEINGEPVRYKEGESELTERAATALLEQDMKRASDGIAKKIKGYDDLHYSVKNALIDTAFNAGTNFISKNPTAKKYFDKGDFISGFASMFDYIGEGGKRSGGLLRRRIDAFNSIEGAPPVDKYKVEANGVFSVHLPTSIGLDPKITKKINGGWLQVTKPKKNSIHPNTAVGIYKV